MNVTAQIVATAVSVGAAIAAAAVWAFRSVVARDVTPALVELRTEAAALTREFAAFREQKEEQRRETTAILSDLHRIVADHETRLTVLEQPGTGRRTPTSTRKVR